MRSRTTRILLLLVLAFGAYAWIFERGKPQNQQDETGPAFSFLPAEVGRVVLLQGTSRLVFEKAAAT